MQLAGKALPLVPALPDVFDKRLKHLTAALRAGDHFHLTAQLLGFPKGAVVPVHGFCCLCDAGGEPYQVRAYVRPTTLSPEVVAYTEREAVRWPSENQHEQWFGTPLMHLVEIDLTDYADSLRLERKPVAAQLPLASATVVPLAAAA